MCTLCESTFRVQGTVSRVQCLGYSVQGTVSRVQYLEYRIQGTVSRSRHLEPDDMTQSVDPRRRLEVNVESRV